MKRMIIPLLLCLMILAEAKARLKDQAANKETGN